jgi:flagella synthesis protein FlgN
LNQLRFASPADFSANLKAEIEALQRFLQILQSEQDALTGGSIDKLADISRLKSEQVVLLSQLTASQFPNSRGTAVSADDITQLIRETDPDGKHGLAKNWGKLTELAKQAQHLNQLNGAMIEAQLKHNQQALAILQEAATQNSLYGPDGHSRTLGTGRQLGKI